MRCPHCGTTLAEADNFCHGCGKDLRSHVSEVAALRETLAGMQHRRDNDIQSLRQALQWDFTLLFRKLDALESTLPSRDAQTLPQTQGLPSPGPEQGHLTAPPALTVQPTVRPAPQPTKSEAVHQTPEPKPLDDRHQKPETTDPKGGFPRQTAPPAPHGVGSMPPPSVQGPADGMAEMHFGQKWLLIGGIIITVFGLGYFLKYSFDQNWIGPAARVALTYLAGIACLGAGEAFRRSDTFRAFGLTLMGGGIATLYFSGFAAFQLYALVGQTAAFGLMVLVTLVAGVLAYAYDAKWLGVLGLVGGFVTPIVLSTGTDNQVALMTYMVVLNLGVLGLARLRDWHLLTVLGFACTWIVFCVWFLNNYHPVDNDKFWPTTLFLNLFYLIHFLAPVAHCAGRGRQVSALGLATAMPNALIAFGFSYYTISRFSSVEYVGIVTLAYAAMSAALASWLYRRQINDRASHAMLLAQGMLFMVITVPVVFSKHWITVFWAAMSMALFWVADRLDSRKAAAAATVLLMLALGKLYLYDYAAVFMLGEGGLYHPSFSEMFFERWLTLATALAAPALAAAWLPAAWRGLRPLFHTVFAVLLFISLNIETAAFFGATARFAALSVLWGVFAVSLVIFGFTRRSSVVRKIGIALFGLTVAKVFLFDMAKFRTPFRIISFMAVGLLLIGASFLYYRFRDRLLRSGEGDGKGGQ